jgi:hypothetical protein
VTHVSLWAIRIIGLLVGFLLLYIAFFMYEDEEGRVQSALEKLWIRVNDRADGASTAVRRLLTETGALSSRAFDAVFGPSLWSRQAIGVSFAFALASMSVYLVAMAPRNVPAFWTIPLMFVALGSLPALTRSQRVTRLVFLLPLGFAIFLLLVALTVASDYVRHADSLGPEFLLVNTVFVGALLVSAPIDFLWALFARWTSRKVCESPRIGMALMALILNLAAVGLLLVFARWPLIGEVIQWNSWIGATLALLLVSRLFLAATAFLFAIVFAIVLLHKVLWPVADRVIYSLARHRVLQNRRLVGALGLALIASSVLGTAFNPTQFGWLR